MSIKSLIQIFILLLIIIIISVVYFQYFSTKKNIVEEINTSKIDDLQKLKELEKNL